MMIIYLPAGLSALRVRRIWRTVSVASPAHQLHQRLRHHLPDHPPLRHRAPHRRCRSCSCLSRRCYRRCRHNVSRRGSPGRCSCSCCRCWRNCRSCGRPRPQGQQL